MVYLDVGVDGSTLVNRNDALDVDVEIDKG